MFERFQNFTQRRVLRRTSSGLLDDEVTEKNPKSIAIAGNVDDKNKIRKAVTVANTDQNIETIELSSDGSEDTSLIGGDRKRRCVEINDYDEDLQNGGIRVAQPASAFKPKCLNFDNVDES